MQLSYDFTLEELTRTSTGLPNQPDDEVERNLLLLANYVLQPIRDRWGALKISSGYRAPAVNKAVGGSETSQHRHGEAADIVPLEADIEAVYRWLVEDSRIAFGQAIFERKGSVWIHISLVRVQGPNQQSMVYDGKQYHNYRQGMVL